MDTSARYRSFGEIEARGSSDTYEEWGLGVAEDPELITLIDQLPESRRQPNLIFGASRHLGAHPGSYASFRIWAVENWSRIAQLASTRTTQTNEAGRTSLLLPILCMLDGPLALIEVGASAGLCLYPDRYSYLYDDSRAVDPPDGPSKVQINCATTGSPPLPDSVPAVAYRAGVDLNPLDVSCEGDMAWLTSLVWPEQHHRRQRLNDAAAIARTDPPHLVHGDLNESVVGLVAAAPPNATVVVFHSAVLSYLDAVERARFVETVTSLPCHWISNEGIGVLPQLAHNLDPNLLSGKFLLALDGQPLALAGGHGQFLEWIAR